jgi:predicted ATPase
LAYRPTEACPRSSGRGRAQLLRNPARQRTLRATIDWSYELLDAHEQRLFARLAVLAGGCTFEAAENTCDAELDTLQSLVDKSLLRHTAERFWMLETIREYATERLEESDEARQLRQRHAQWYLDLAERAYPELRGAEQATWLEQLEEEHDNFRSVLGWSLSGGGFETALQLSGALFRFGSRVVTSPKAGVGSRALFSLSARPPHGRGHFAAWRSSRWSRATSIGLRTPLKRRSL